jgi:hypothetical protein
VREVEQTNLSYVLQVVKWGFLAWQYFDPYFSQWKSKSIMSLWRLRVVSRCATFKQENLLFDSNDSTAIESVLHGAFIAIRQNFNDRADDPLLSKQNPTQLDLPKPHGRFVSPRPSWGPPPKSEIDLVQQSQVILADLLTLLT